jgi:hypothetical protein
VVLVGTTARSRERPLPVAPSGWVLLAGTCATANAWAGGWVANGAGIIPRAGQCECFGGHPARPPVLVLALSLSLNLGGPVRLRAHHRSAVHSITRRLAWSARPGISDLASHPPGAVLP